ncbi:MAG: ACT domain-containing protein [Acidimicrobiia bacterium]
MTEFVIRMDNRPGRLAALTEALAAAGVNIEALAAFGLDGDGVIRLIVDNADAARRTFREAGLVAEEHTVLTAFFENTPGQLASVARRLADSDINIDAVYVLNSGADGIELAVVVDQPESAMPHIPVRGGLGGR